VAEPAAASERRPPVTTTASRRARTAGIFSRGVGLKPTEQPIPGRLFDRPVLWHLQPHGFFAIYAALWVQVQPRDSVPFCGAQGPKTTMATLHPLPLTLGSSQLHATVMHGDCVHVYCKPESTEVFEENYSGMLACLVLRGDRQTCKM
jgi:hypothetical protein